MATDTYLPYHSGIVSSVRQLSSALARESHEVTVVAPVPAGIRHREIAIDGVNLVTVPARPLRWISYRPIPSPRQAHRILHGLLTADRPDVVHIHTPFLIGQLALRNAQALGVPIACTLHLQPGNVASYSPVSRIASKIAVRAVETAYGRLLRGASLVSTPTSFAAAYAGRLAALDEIHVISNGVPIPDSQTRDRESAPPVILYVGRLSAEKRIDLLLDAARLLQLNADFTLRIVGSGHDGETLMRRARSMSLRNCEFLGIVSDDELRDIYRHADIFCMPSPVELECIAMLEAMANGLPVVVPNAGALSEVTEESGGAIVYDADRGPAGVADALGILLADARMRETMGANARAKVAARNISEIAGQWTVLYSNMTSAPRRDIPGSRVEPWVATRTFQASSGGLLMSHWTEHDSAKPTLVLLHGIAVDAITCWSSVARLMSDRYNLVAFDLYGHGSIIDGDRQADLLADFASGLSEAISHYGLTGCTVIGHSLGGAITQLLLRTAPAGAVKEAVLSSTGARFSTTRLDRAYFLWVASATGLVRRLPGPAQALVGRISARLQGMTSYPHFSASRMDWHQVLSSGVLLSRFDSRGWISNVDIPVGQIITRLDRVVSFSKQAELRRLLKHADARVTNLAHDASITEPEQYVTVLRTILAALEAAKRTS